MRLRADHRGAAGGGRGRRGVGQVLYAMGERGEGGAFAECEAKLRRRRVRVAEAATAGRVLVLFLDAGGQRWCMISSAWPSRPFGGRGRTEVVERCGASSWNPVGWNPPWRKRGARYPVTAYHVCVHIERQVLRVAHQASVRQVREAGVWTLSRK